MPFDGAGNYTPAAAPNFPAISGNPISSTYYNVVVNDVATGLSNTLTRDGQGKPSAAIDWNNKNLTNVAAFAAASATLTAALPVTSGGTGLITAPANGRLLIGNGTTYTSANITAGTGIAITNGAGSITIDVTAGGGSVISVSGAGGTTGLTLTGGPITTIGTLTLGGTLAIANGGTGAITGPLALTALGAAVAGLATASTITTLTGVLLGRTTAATGAIESITPGATLTLAAGALGVASVPNALTINNGGAGAASGTTFNGSAIRTISYNTIGAKASNPVIQSVTTAATVTPTFLNDQVNITAQVGALTLANPTGTAVDGWRIVVRMRAGAPNPAISYGAQYRTTVGGGLPNNIHPSDTGYLIMLYNSADTKWDVTEIIGF